MTGELRWIVISMAALSLVACDRIDRESASREIRARFCAKWPHGCSESLRVIVEGSRESGPGRSVEFRIVEGPDTTGRLSGAYFRRNDQRDWEFVLFEGPFDRALRDYIRGIEEDRRAVTERLLALKSAQEWHRSIYRSYAVTFDELKRVNFAPGESRPRMTVESDRSGWMAKLTGRFVECTLRSTDASPECRNRSRSGGIGTFSGTLAAN